MPLPPDDAGVIAEMEQRIAKAWLDGDRTTIEAILAPDGP
jgi:hypothetical protein